MQRTDKIKMLTYISKFFTILTFISSWYAQAAEDEIIEATELIELGAGICGILGLKTAIKLPASNE